ncbi:hypothetical protein GCM10027082_47200 [Comamonas humi]
MDRAVCWSETISKIQGIAMHRSSLNPIATYVMLCLAAFGFLQASASANDIEQEQVARAASEMNHHPSDKYAYDLSIAKADAQEKCDEQAGNAKYLCRQQAKTAHMDALAAAKRAARRADAQARENSDDARSGAAIDKHDAVYDLAR